MNPERVHAELLETSVVAVIRERDRSVAERIADAAIGAGVRAVEITMTVDGADELLATLHRRHGDALLLGVGTVLDPAHVGPAVEAGARYVVAPHFDLAVVDAARRSGALPVPGVLTPREVAEAWREGLGLLKLYPAATVGPSHLAALRSVYPAVAFIPTGGISADCSAWFAAGAAAVGVSGALNAAFARAGADGVAELSRNLLASAARTSLR